MHFQNRLRLSPLPTLLVAVVIITAVLAAWGFQINEVWDDAYITFQYARQLTDGAGIVYYPGDQPSQGSTSMLFLLLTSTALRLGISAEAAAFVFNAIGMYMIAAAAFLFSRFVTTNLVWRGVLALLPALSSAVIYHQTSGLETNLWTGLVLLTAALLTLPRTRRMVSVYTVLSFLICLTRPDSALFVGVWWLALLIENRRQNLPLFLGFLAAGLLYLAALYLYFGDILPTAYYIKVGAEGGVRYVLYFLSSVVISPLVIWGLWTLRRSPVLWWTAPILTLPIFYLFTKPLNGGVFRFFHPLTCLAIIYGSLGLFLLAGWVRGKMPVRWRPLAGLTATAILLAVNTYPVGVNLISRQSIPAEPLRLWSHALAQIDPPISIIYGDAGMLPYLSGQRLIDPVGLAEPTIARNAAKHGKGWVIDYLLDQRADVIGFYIGFDGQLYNAAHGVIGSAYSDLYQAADFQANYQLIGALNYGSHYCVWFVRNDSPALAELQAAIRPLAMAEIPPIIP